MAFNDSDAEVMHPTRYSAPAQAFHWAIAVLVLAGFVFAPEGRDAPALQREWHETIGFAVLLLSAARLVWRLGDHHPDPPAVSRWLGWGAGALQVALYVLLFLVPLTAVVGTWLEGHALQMLGGVRMVPWIEPNRDWGHTLSDLHAWLGNAILWVAGIHAAAALVHHFILRDGVLRSMLPRWRRGETDD
jgi:cytochrome b561